MGEGEVERIINAENAKSAEKGIKECLMFNAQFPITNFRSSLVPHYFHAKNAKKNQQQSNLFAVIPAEAGIQSENRQPVRGDTW